VSKCVLQKFLGKQLSDNFLYEIGVGGSCDKLENLRQCCTEIHILKI